MPKARVQGSSAVIKVKDPFLGLDIQIGEIDGFSAKSTTSINKSRPIGASIETAQIRYGGFELSFKGGKVDWHLAKLLHAQDTLLRTIGVAPVFTIEQTVKYFDGSKEIFSYPNSVIFGYEFNADGADNELGENFSGFASYRIDLDNIPQNETVYSIVNAMVQEGSKSLTSEILEGVGGMIGRIMGG